MVRLSEPRSQMHTRAQREEVARNLSPSQAALMDNASAYGRTRLGRPKTAVFRGAEYKLKREGEDDAEHLVTNGLFCRNDTPSSHEYSLTATGELILAAWHALRQERIQALIDLHRIAE